MPKIEILSIRPVGQISGTTGARWPNLVDSQGRPLLTDTGRWNVMGVDLGANAEHSDGRLYVFFGDAATNRSGTPPDNGDLVAWTDEPELLEHGGHLALGWLFTLPLTPGQEGQPGWSRCRKCSVLFFDGQPFRGECSGRGGHAATGDGLTLPLEPTQVAGQHQWRRCRKCSSLFFWEDEDDPATAGFCPAGGNHDAGDERFVIPVTGPDVAGQAGWRFCGSCHGLFYDGEASKGVCRASAGGGFHLQPVLRSGASVFDEFRGPAPIGHLGRDETPNGAFSFGGTMYVFAGFPEPQYAHVQRPGDPLGGQYLFSKRDPSRPGPYDVEFLLSPKLGLCARDEARSVVATHFPMGFRFVLEHSRTPSEDRSDGWRLCRRCEAIFFAGDPSDLGICQNGAPHVPGPPENFSFRHGTIEDVQTQAGFHRCARCRALFWSRPGDSDTGFCPAGGRHNSDGSELQVPHDSVDALDPTRRDWRFCTECFCLYWDEGDPRNRGVCAGNPDGHRRAGFNFVLPVIVGDVAGSEPYWRFCGKCRVLFLEGDDNCCPGDGGDHTARGWRFPLTHGVPETIERQGNWRRCRKCSALFFDGFEASGRCPRDGAEHENEFLGTRYLLDHNPGADDRNRAGFRFCVRCHGMVRADQPARVPWVAPVVVDNADHPVLPSRTGKGVVMIGYDWERFRLLWMPLFPGEAPRAHQILYYHARKGTWTREIDDEPGFHLFQHRLFAPGPHIRYTHVSAIWLAGPECWVVLYAAASAGTREFDQPVIAKFSANLKKWTPDVTIFDPNRERAWGAYMHKPGADQIRDKVPPTPGVEDIPGWAYGAFVLDRYTRFDEDSRILTLTYLLSTSMPYQVHVMQTRLRLPFFQVDLPIDVEDLTNDVDG